MRFSAKNNRKFSFLYIVIALFISISFFQTSSFASSSPQIINLVAKVPESGLNGIDLQLQANNLSIQEYIPPKSSGWEIVQGNCNAQGASFSNNTVCVYLSKSTPIQDNESLGQIRVIFSNDKESSLVKTEKNIYSDGNRTISDTGIAAIFRVETPTNQSQSLDVISDLGDPIIEDLDITKEDSREINIAIGDKTSLEEPVVPNINTISTDSEETSQDNRIVFAIGAALLTIVVLTSFIVLRNLSKKKDS